MKEVKKKMLRLFFTLELIIFLGIYGVGPHGICYVWHLEKEIETIDRDIVTIKAENAALSERILAWHRYPYYKESIARVDLQMADPQELIYYF